MTLCDDRIGGESKWAIAFDRPSSSLCMIGMAIHKSGTKAGRRSRCGRIRLIPSAGPDADAAADLARNPLDAA